MAEPKDLVDAVSHKAIKTIKKDVPLIDGAWVKFYEDLTAEDQTRIAKLKDNEEGGYELTKCLVADWNFADAEKNKLDVTVENVKKLPIKVQAWLAKTGTEILTTGLEVKKELPKT